MNVHVPPGGELAGYQVERVLGRGGMSIVYLARDPQLGRRVALKVLAAELSEDARFRERFLRESQLAAGLDHPRIVPVYAAGEADGLLYIAMRYVEGHDLRALLRTEGPLAPPRALALVAQVADALDAAHEAGLVHRDVKPGNVLVSARRGSGGEEHAYLADFGLAKRPATVASATGVGLAGTIAYAAPEQIEGAALDGRADVYALGCLLFECLAGVPPFVRESELAVVFAHLQEPPPHITDARPELPAALDAVIRKALAKKPGQRYATCGALVDAARAALPATAAAAVAPRRRRTGAIVAAAAAAVVVGVGAVVYVTGRGGHPAATAAVGAAPLRAPASSLALIDPRTNRVAAVIPVHDVPSRVVASGSTIWVASADDKTLTRVDGRTRRVLATLELGATPTGLAAGSGDSAWVALGLANQLDHVSVTGGGYEQDRIPIRRCCAQPTIVTTSGSAVWIADASGTRKVDPDSATVGPATPGTGSAGAVALPDGSVWVADGWDRLSHVTRPGAPAAATLHANARGGGPGQPGGMVDDGASVWIAGSQANEVYRVDEASASVTAIAVGDSPAAVGRGAGAIWVANAGGGTITRIDPVTARVVTAVAVGQRPAAVTATPQGIWVGVQGTNAATPALELAAQGVSPPGAPAPALGVMRADASHRRQLTGAVVPGFGFTDYSPAWAPDGRRVLFMRVGLQPGSAQVTSNLHSHLFVIGEDGKGLRQLTRSAAADDGPAWAPNGAEIAFARAPTYDLLGVTSRIWLMRPDGTHVHAIGPACGATHPAWSPDGTAIAFACSKSQRLYAMRADGTNLRRLPNNADAATPAIAPDGVRVAYAGGIADPNVYVTTMRSRAAATLVALGPNDAAAIPSWSPDGSRIAFGEGNQLYVAYADGTGLTPLRGQSGTPAWRPTR